MVSAAAYRVSEKVPRPGWPAAFPVNLPLNVLPSGLTAPVVFIVARPYFGILSESCTVDLRGIGTLLLRSPADVFFGAAGIAFACWGIMVARADEPEERETPAHAPELTEEDERKAEKSAAVPAPVIHEVIRAAGEAELARPVSALAWSGVAAGMSMSFSLIAEGLLRSHLPLDAPWTPLITKFGYTVGFVVVILGRQQLFTENTLTAVLPVLARRNLRTLLSMLRLWSVVLIANLVGAVIVAWVLGNTNAFDPIVRNAFAFLGHRAADHSFGTLVLRGSFAGWLIAMVVWLLPAAQAARIWIIILLTWLVGLADLSHIIAGSVEVLYLTTTGALSWGHFFGLYMVPTLIGNCIGGVALVAAFNHAQVVSGRPRQNGKG